MHTLALSTTTYVIIGLAAWLTLLSLILIFLTGARTHPSSGRPTDRQTDRQTSPPNPEQNRDTDGTR